MTEAKDTSQTSGPIHKLHNITTQKAVLFITVLPHTHPPKNLSNNRYKFANLPLDGGRLSLWSLLHVAWSSQHNRISQQILLVILRLQVEQILCAESKSLFQTPWQWVSKENGYI